jgi:hypothetical protein
MAWNEKIWLEEKSRQDIIDWLDLVDMDLAKKEEPMCSMPRAIVDNYLNKLSPSAWKVFSYLNSKANLVEWASGKCVVSYKEIEDVTGVKASHMYVYIRELVNLGLIERKMLFLRKEGNKKGAFHLFEVCWYKAQPEYSQRPK